MTRTSFFGIVLLAALVGGSFYLSRATAQLAVPPDTITILRDKWGVPHVFTTDDEKGAFAVGYAMAEDRLFQMDLLRRAGKGRLAELIGDQEALGGKSAADFDVSVRRELYTEPERQDMFAQLMASDPASGKSFLAYVDGVNLFIAQALADPVHKLPSEYVALGALPEPWLVTDSIAFAAVGLSIFGAEGGNEVQNATLLLDLIDRFGGDEAAATGIFDDLFWIDDPDAPVTINEGSAIFPNLVNRFAPIQMALLHDEKVKSAIRKAAAVQHDEQAAIDEIGRRLGLRAAVGHSNALVVSGAHTATVHPMLGGGPQVGYSTPSFFWESGFHSPTYDSVGVNVPLGPGNIMGRTATLAYTVTSGIDDQIDTYVERLNPDDVRQYGSPGHWRDMDCRTETFLVRLNPTNAPGMLQAAAGNSSPADGVTNLLGLSTNDPLRPKPPVRPIVQELCRTTHGPVFFIDTENLVAFSHKKAHWMQDLKGAAAWLNLGRKTTLVGPGSVEEALDKFPFTFNFNYASTSGDIAYFHRGLIPLRPLGPDHLGTDPRLPLPGDGAEWRVGADGKDYVAASDILTTDGRKAATIVNPAQGFVANWNNKPIKGWGGAGEARELWGPRHRMEGLSREVARLVAAGTPISLNEGGSLDGATQPACFRQDDYTAGTDPLGCVTSVNGIVRKAATSDIHALTVLPFLKKALAVEQTDHTSPEYRAYELMQQWSDAGGPLLRTGSDPTYRFPGVAIYRDWRDRLQHTLLDDELGSHNRGMDYPAVISGSNEDDHGSYLTPDGLLYHILTHAPELQDPNVPPPTTLAPSSNRNYCENVGTHDGATCAHLLVSTLNQTVAALTIKLGASDPSNWHETVIVSTVSSQGAAPEVKIERMNRGSWNQLHDFGAGDQFLTFNVVPPGNSGFIDLATLVQSQAANDPKAAVDAGNPHVFEQLDLYQGWRYKHFVQHQSELEDPKPESIPYVRGVIPMADPTLLRSLVRLLDQLGVPLPNLTILGEVSTE